MNSSSVKDLVKDKKIHIINEGINQHFLRINQLAQKLQSAHHNFNQSSQSSNKRALSSRKLDSSNSPKKESDLKNQAVNLLQKINLHQDYSIWREEKNTFLKNIRLSFEEFFDKVSEQLEKIIKQQEIQNIFEKHKSIMQDISQKRNFVSDEDLNFFKNQCCSGKLEKELQILEQNKQLKQNILIDFYSDIMITLKNLKNTDLVLLDKLKKPDQIILHEIKRDIQYDNPKYLNKLNLKQVDYPLQERNQHKTPSDCQKSHISDNKCRNSHLMLTHQQIDLLNSSPLIQKSPRRQRNMTTSPCQSPVSKQNNKRTSNGFQMQNSPQILIESVQQYQNQFSFQGKKNYNFEFSLEETQNVLLKNENELILIGEQIKIWNNQLRKITYEKKIDQIYFLHGKKYQIGWRQFSVLDNKHVIIGNNKSKQIFIFKIKPFRLIKVLEDDAHQNSSDSISPLVSPPQIYNNCQFNHQNQNILRGQNISVQENILASPILNQPSLYFDFQNEDSFQEQNSRSYGNFIKVNENMMACNCNNYQIQVWNIKNNELIHTIKVGNPKNKINRLIKINKQTVASHCENDNHIRFWNCLTGKYQKKSLILPTKMIQNMWTFKSFLYVVSFKNTIYIYNLNTLKLLKYVQLPFQIVLSKQLSEDYIVGVQNYNEVFALSLKDFSLKKVIKMEFQITDIIIFNSRVFATFNICSESRKGKIEYLQ